MDLSYATCRNWIDGGDGLSVQMIALADGVRSGTQIFVLPEDRHFPLSDV